jgi:hypothetical protein
MQPVQARVIDANHLKLMQPIQISPGSNVLVMIVSLEGMRESQAWYQLSAQGLATAYGAGEPEYSVDLIQVPNQDFQP